MTQRWMRTTRPLAVAAVTLALTLTACGGHSSTTATTATGGPASGAGTRPSLPTTTLPEASPALGATLVTVTETEYKLTFSTTSFQPGAYTFVAVNRGTGVHALAISGQGIHDSTGDIQPGQSARLGVTLKAGRYDVYCPIPGHKSLGMNKEITVAR